MAEATQVLYKHEELVTLMLKDQGIHDGFWMLCVQFGFGVANAGPSDSEMNPTAMVPITAIGIQRMPTKGPLTVDASSVNARTQT